jgi:hypothetical protein
MDLTLFFPIVFLIIIGLFAVIIVIVSLTKNRAQTAQSKRYRNRRQVYVSGEFGSVQMELDLRLPYRRFRELYPSSKLTYREYKHLQMQRAFRRSMSSQENKRMVQ